MNRFAAYALLGAFLHLQGATCCHCRQSESGANHSASAIQNCCQEHCCCDDLGNRVESPIGQKTDDTPPCGPHHGSHLHVISHLVYVGPGPALKFCIDAGITLTIPQEPLMRLSEAMIGGAHTDADVIQVVTLFNRGTLLRV